MKIVAIDKRTLVIPPETYLEILEILKKERKYTCKFDGKPYYLAEMNMVRNKIIEARFISINPIEIEVTDDE